MTDGSSPTRTPSSWNFDDLQHDDDDGTAGDFFSTLKRKVAQHVYFDEPGNSPATNPPSERACTERIDGSDLISRCKQFLPLLTDANRTLMSQMQSGANVRIELDSDSGEDDERGQRIEMNLMFCPSGESDDDSSDSDDEPLAQEKKPVSIVELPSAETDEHVDQ